MQSSDTNLNSMAGTGGSYYRQYLALFSILIVCICMYGILSVAGFSYYPDEFGYWATAAANVGYDWSEVASLGSYYSFGYSLILTPILFVFGGGLAAFRAAIIINMCMHVCSLCLMCAIARRLFPKSKQMDIIYSVGIAAFYPVWIFYVQMTLAEALITFLYVLICYFFVLIFEKPQVKTIAALMVLLVYICCVHMRTISICIAAAIVLTLWAWNNPTYRKYILIILVLGVAGIIGLAAVKMNVTSNVYKDADAALLAGNTFAGQLETFRYLLTAEGFFGFLQGIAGKIFYLGAASFGLFYITLIYSFRRLIGLLKSTFISKSAVDIHQLFGAFLFLSMVGQFLVTALYMNIVSGPHEIFYGRYNEYILPMYMMIAALQMLRDGKIVRRYIYAAIASVSTGVIATLYMLRLGHTNMHAYFVAGISYMWETNRFQPDFDMWGSIILSLEAMLLVMLCVMAGRIRGIGQIMLTLVIAMEIVLGLTLCIKNTYPSSRVDRNDLQIYRYIDRFAEEDTPIQYLAENNHTFIDIIQFYMGERSIDVIHNESEIVPNAYLIIDAESPSIERFNEIYNLCRESAWFKLYEVQ